MKFFQIIVLRAKKKFIIFIQASPLKSVKAINLDSQQLIKVISEL